MKNKTAKRAYKAYLRSFQKAPYDPNNPPQRNMQHGQSRRAVRLVAEALWRGSNKLREELGPNTGLYHMSIFETLTAANGFTIHGKP